MIRRLIVAIFVLVLLIPCSGHAEETAPRSLEEIRACGVLRVGTAGDY